MYNDLIDNIYCGIIKADRYLPISARFLFQPPSHGRGGGGAAAAPTVCNMPPVEHHSTFRGMRGRTPLAANDGGKTLYRVA